MTRVLVTGAGSAAALAFVDSIRAQRVSLFLGDSDPCSPALSSVSPDRRIGLPRLDGSVYAEVLLQACAEHDIDVVVPTRDAELLSLARRRHRFTAIGTTLMLPSTASLETALDRWSLYRVCDGLAHRPRTAVFGSDVELSRWRFPLVLKPRYRADPRPVHVVRSAAEARRLRRDNALLLQEHLPGEEVQVDVLTGPLGSIVAAAPRDADGPTAHLHHCADAIVAARRVVRALRLSYASTVKFRRDRDGRLALLDVVPRVSEGMTASVTAGVNLPWLAVQLAMGESMPSTGLPCREVVFRDSAAPGHASTETLVARSALNAGLELAS